MHPPSRSPKARRPLRLRVGIDAGGTFTDLVALGDGVEVALKVPSTPADPARAVTAALRQLEERLEGRAGPLLLDVVHGTTVATNALLEGRGARVVFVTNAGFEDLLEIGRQARPDLYDLTPRRAAPLVARADRIGVAERTRADGSRELRPSPRELARLVRRVRARRPQSIAIGLLHAYANPASERALAARLRALGLPVSRSSAVAPLFREFERFSTTVANAALVPLCRDYLEQLAATRPRTRFFVLQSNGGLTTARAAARRPVALVLSGPAGGLAAAQARLAAAGVRGAITLDMGGTSTDVGLVLRGHARGLGELERTDQIDLDGRPLLVDALAVHSIGAGGGSRLWIDDGGSLRVGPQSAGADPGPACYGKGTTPCLTDAHVVLGRLPLREKLGGAITLDPRRSHAALAPLARRLRVAPRALAAAALDVADAAMEKAVKKMSLERGHDPRELALFAFGGAGGLHACRLARRLAMREVVVPPLPGATSAWGMATSDARLSFARGFVRTLDAATLAEIGRAFDRLEREARQELRRELGPGAARIERALACRYRGQSFELDVPFTAACAERFEALHAARYGFRLPGCAIESVALRVAAVRAAPRIRGAPAARRTSTSTATTGRGAHGVAQFERAELPRGCALRGPCIVLESTATTFVEAGCTLRVDATGCLRIRSA